MKTKGRFVCLTIAFLLSYLLISYRLFYWQIIKDDNLSLLARLQRWSVLPIPAQRGKILSIDKMPLVTNQIVYLLYAIVSDLNEKPEKIASISGLEITDIKEKLRRQDLIWLPLKHRLSGEEKVRIENLQIKGLGFEEEAVRRYPEGSGSAHLTGFVGVDVNGLEKGYFGLEGFYNLELRGQPGVLKRENDATGKPILIGKLQKEEPKPGRSLVTTIDRPVQFLIEKKLRQGLESYQANAGSVIIMEPKSGEILAMASYPNYDPEKYWLYDNNLYPNPNIAFSYEPGSTFKVLVISAAIDSGVVKAEDRCDRCDGPRIIDIFTIKTWNEKYYPNSSMTEIIQHSDNVGMVYVAEKLGVSKMYDYLKKFEIGQKTGIDLQEESSPKLRDKLDWGPVELATAGFGQGVALTPIQMIKAVGAIANDGIIVKPFVVESILDGDNIINIQPEEGKRILKATTTEVITEMMINAVDNGEAKWAKPKGYRIAGKTGTAQIPIAGHYDKDKTIASFVGFAPADNPKFIMLVTLKEPKSSPWGSETAAPLWFSIAKDLFLYYGIMPG